MSLFSRKSKSLPEASLQIFLTVYCPDLIPSHCQSGWDNQDCFSLIRKHYRGCVHVSQGTGQAEEGGYPTKQGGLVGRRKAGVKVDVRGRQPPCLKHLPAREAKGSRTFCFEVVQGRGVGQGGKVKRGWASHFSGVWGPGCPCAQGAALSLCPELIPLVCPSLTGIPALVCLTNLEHSFLCLHSLSISYSSVITGEGACREQDKENPKEQGSLWAAHRSSKTWACHTQPPSFRQIFSILLRL